jgi:hypothetical protein
METLVFSSKQPAWSVVENPPRERLKPVRLARRFFSGLRGVLMGSPNRTLNEEVLGHMTAIAVQARPK